jgi:hypothetical protein
MTTTLGPAIGALDIRRCAQATLELWMPSIVVELARRADDRYPPGAGEPTFEQVVIPPRDYQRLPDEDVWDLAADQTPVVAVSSPGVPKVTRDSDGLYSAEWMVHVAVIVRGDTFEQTTDILGIYLTAARMALCQHGLGLQGASKPRWVTETYKELDTDVSRSLQGGSTTVRVRVADVMDDTAGPAEPPEAPDYIDPEPVLAETVNTEVTSL